jgi:hypothetical protein
LTNGLGPPQVVDLGTPGGLQQQPGAFAQQQGDWGQLPMSRRSPATAGNRLCKRIRPPGEGLFSGQQLRPLLVYRERRVPQRIQRARALRLAHNVRFGAAVTALRQRHALGQAQVSGLSERQVRRIEQGARPRPATQGALAESHGLSPAAHLDALAAEMGPR